MKTQQFLIEARFLLSVIESCNDFTHSKEFECTINSNNTPYTQMIGGYGIRYVKYPNRDAGWQIKGLIGAKSCTSKVFKNYNDMIDELNIMEKERYQWKKSLYPEYFDYSGTTLNFQLA